MRRRQKSDKYVTRPLPSQNVTWRHVLYACAVSMVRDGWHRDITQAWRIFGAARAGWSPVHLELWAPDVSCVYSLYVYCLLDCSAKGCRFETHTGLCLKNNSSSLAVQKEKIGLRLPYTLVTVNPHSFTDPSGHTTITINHCFYIYLLSWWSDSPRTILVRWEYVFAKGLLGKISFISYDSLSDPSGIRLGYFTPGNLFHIFITRVQGICGVGTFFYYYRHKNSSLIYRVLPRENDFPSFMNMTPEVVGAFSLR